MAYDPVDQVYYVIDATDRTMVKDESQTWKLHKVDPAAGKSLAVADNGIGVDKDQLCKIFDAMYRTDPARSQVSQGSGLGLAVCKQIVEQNGGSIWARSHTDAGLSIFISLPKREHVADEADIDY